MQSSRIVAKVCKTIAQRNASTFSGSAISGPPTVHVSKAEKAVLGGIMLTSFMIIPSWVMIHMEEYKGNK